MPRTGDRCVIGIYLLVYLFAVIYIQRRPGISKTQYNDNNSNVNIYADTQIDSAAFNKCQRMTRRSVNYLFY